MIGLFRVPTRIVVLVCLVLVGLVRHARADEIWVAPTYQADLGGLGIGSNGLWPVSVVGASRLAWGVPNDLQAFQNAKVVLIPHAGGAASLNVFICHAAHTDLVTSCAGPFEHAFVGVPNQLLEVDISVEVGARVGVRGATYLTVLAYSTPTTTTDHIVGLRFAYDRTPPGGDTVGSLQVITDSLTANDLAPDSVGTSEVAFNYAGSTSEGGAANDVACVACVATTEVSFGFATPGANTFTGTQTINFGNLDLDLSSATTGVLTKNGTRFLYNVGNSSTFLGINAGNFTVTGDGNTGIGFAVLQNTTNGGSNTAAGTNSMLNNTEGDENTAMGSITLTANTIGDQNTAIGSRALTRNISGGFNTAIGRSALFSNTTGSNHVAIGVGAGFSATTETNNIYLGYNVQGTAGESNTIFIGGVFHTKAFIGGIRGRTTGVANAIPVLIDSAGQLGTVSSSRRYKEDIQDLADKSRRLFQLRPVAFRYTQPFAGGVKPVHYGLIAEEVAEVFPELAIMNEEGQPETVKYQDLSVLLLNELQRQEQDLIAERARIETLERQLADVMQQLTRIASER